MCIWKGNNAEGTDSLFNDFPVVAYSGSDEENRESYHSSMKKLVYFLIHTKKNSNGRMRKNTRGRWKA